MALAFWRTSAIAGALTILGACSTAPEPRPATVIPQDSAPEDSDEIRIKGTPGPERAAAPGPSLDRIHELEIAAKQSERRNRPEPLATSPSLPVAADRGTPSPPPSQEVLRARAEFIARQQVARERLAERCRLTGSRIGTSPETTKRATTQVLEFFQPFTEAGLEVTDDVMIERIFTAQAETDRVIKDAVDRSFAK